MKDERAYLGHILRCISRIEEYVSGSPDGFASHVVQDAVLRNLQTMAESTQRLSAASKSGAPMLTGRPWLASAMCSFMPIWASISIRSSMRSSRTCRS